MNFWLDFGLDLIFDWTLAWTCELFIELLKVDELENELWGELLVSLKRTLSYLGFLIITLISGCGGGLGFWGRKHVGVYSP